MGDLLLNIVFVKITMRYFLNNMGINATRKTDIFRMFFLQNSYPVKMLTLVFLCWMKNLPKIVLNYFLAELIFLIGQNMSYLSQLSTDISAAIIYTYVSLKSKAVQPSQVRAIRALAWLTNLLVSVGYKKNNNWEEGVADKHVQ